MRGLIAAAERLCAALAPAVRGLDLAGLSWRQLRGFQRGAACLADCRAGHTYGPWCQLGWPIPGPTYLLQAFAEATMPMPLPAQRLNEEQLAAIHEALTQIALLPEELDDGLRQAMDAAVELEITGELWVDEQGRRIDPPVDRPVACTWGEPKGEHYDDCAPDGER